MKYKLQIKSIVGKVLFTYVSEQKPSLKEALMHAVTKGVDLRGADLRGANLRGANLLGADLLSADLRGADLLSANFRDADLRETDLRGANLLEADLRDAHLLRADLRGANLFSASLLGATLLRADLRGANLMVADLEEIKKDYYKVLKSNQNEVSEFYKKLLEGKINGSTYEGECACLVGTMANIKNVDYRNLEPISNRPSERWFLAIQKGDTPENNQVSAIVKDWTEEFMKENDIDVPVMKVVWRVL